MNELLYHVVFFYDANHHLKETTLFKSINIDHFLHQKHNHITEFGYAYGYTRDVVAYGEAVEVFWRKDDEPSKN